MAWDIKEAIYSFFLITFIASIFAFYFGTLSFTGYIPNQDTNIADAIGIKQTQFNSMKQKIQDLNAMQFGEGGSEASGTAKTTPSTFQDYVAGAAGFVAESICKFPLVSTACANFGAAGVIAGLLENTITWSWFFVDKIFDPANASLSILGWAFKGIFSLIQVVGILWLMITVVNAIRGGK
jgi:hypothetical protein